MLRCPPGSRPAEAARNESRVNPATLPYEPGAATIFGPNAQLGPGRTRQRRLLGRRSPGPMPARNQGRGGTRQCRQGTGHRSAHRGRRAGSWFGAQRGPRRNPGNALTGMTYLAEAQHAQRGPGRTRQRRRRRVAGRSTQATHNEGRGRTRQRAARTENGGPVTGSKPLCSCQGSSTIRERGIGVLEGGLRNRGERRTSVSVLAADRC